MAALPAALTSPVRYMGMCAVPHNTVFDHHKTGLDRLPTAPPSVEDIHGGARPAWSRHQLRPSPKVPVPR